MSSKIGIGITTFNRASVLEKMLSKNTPAFKDKVVMISDDGSTDSTKEVLQKFDFPWITGPNIGVAGNKNRLFFQLQDCDFIFMADDDVLVSSGFEEIYLKAFKASGIHHFTYSPPGKHWGRCLGETIFGEVVIQHTRLDGGAFSFYTKEVLDACGGYNSWSHRDHSERIWRCGLVGKEKINHIKGSEVLVKLMSVPSSVVKEGRNFFKRFEKSVWESMWKDKFCWM